MSKSYKEFLKVSSSLTNKDESINNFIMYAVNKLQSMFTYENLPDSIPSKWLEYYLMCNGSCFVTKVNGNLYALVGGAGGEYDAYYQPTIYTVANPALKVSREYKIGIDGVLVRNDTLMMGMLPIITKYGSLLTEADITMRTALINMRITQLISAPDDTSKASADEYIKKVINGELSVIADNPFFSGVKLQDTTTFNGYMQQIIEATQYIKASFYNEIGLNANYNLKREYISDSENSLADDILLPLVDNMLKERKEGLEAINEMFGTDISVELNSSWKTNNAENEKEIATAESVTNSDTTDDTDDNTTSGADDSNSDDSDDGGDVDENSGNDNTTDTN